MIYLKISLTLFLGMFIINSSCAADKPIISLDKVQSDSLKKEAAMKCPKTKVVGTKENKEGLTVGMVKHIRDQYAKVSYEIGGQKKETDYKFILKTQLNKTNQIQFLIYVFLSIIPFSNSSTKSKNVLA